MVFSCSPTGNRRIRVRSPAAEAPSTSCTGEAPPVWSAVCSPLRTAGPRPGAKMMPGGGIPTSRAPTQARSASGPQGRQEHGRRPTGDPLASVGTERETDEEQPTGMKDIMYARGSVLSHTPVSETAAPSEGVSYGAADL
jgi:hypothetical protein